MPTRQSLVIFIVFVLLAVGVYYGFDEYKTYKKNKSPFSKAIAYRDKGISNVKIDIRSDTYSPALYITAKWDSKLIGVAKSSVTMECVATRTESGKGRKVIRSDYMKGLSRRGSGMGSLTCHVMKNDLTKKRPYLWVRIIAVIKGKRQTSIVKYLGKFH